MKYCLSVRRAELDGHAGDAVLDDLLGEAAILLSEGHGDAFLDPSSSLLVLKSEVVQVHQVRLQFVLVRERSRSTRSCRSRFSCTAEPHHEAPSNDTTSGTTLRSSKLRNSSNGVGQEHPDE